MGDAFSVPFILSCRNSITFSSIALLSVSFKWEIVKILACEQAPCFGKAGVKKSRGEGRKRVRSCRKTFQAAIPPSCLVIADHLSARSLSVTWIHWNVIMISRVKRRSVGNTQLLRRAKMLLFSMSFFCSGGFSFNWENVISAAYFIPERSWYAYCVCLHALTLSLLSPRDFFTLSPNREPVHRLSKQAWLESEW